MLERVIGPLLTVLTAITTRETIYSVVVRTTLIVDRLGHALINAVLIVNIGTTAASFARSIVRRLS